MYIGIGEKRGLKVHDEDTFMVAMEHCFTDEAEAFMEEFGDAIRNLTVDGMSQFREDVVSWYFSDWNYREE